MSTVAPLLPDLGRPRRIHVVGAGGAGMSAIAAVLAEMGHHVTGSDIKPTQSLERLRACGVEVTIGHRPANLDGAELLTYSSAVPEGNIELVTARERNIAVLPRAVMLEAIVALRRTIAVAGTHGKTTTSSMLALVLAEAGLHPSFIIGGELNEIGTNAAWESGQLLVVEADESDGTFLHLEPELAVVTSVEPDHLDHYGSLAALEQAFGTFAARARAAVVCADDPVAARLAPPSALGYGTAAGAQLRIVGFESARNHVRFRLEHRGEGLGTFELPVPGLHNALNAAACVAACLELGVDVEHARLALARFAGVARRFEFKGERDGVVFVDDYAHLPGEVKAALAAAAAGGFGRVVCVFQPHRFSRVAALAEAFADAFVAADVLVVTDIYPAGERARPGVSGRLVFEAVRRSHPDAEVLYLPGRAELVARLRGLLRRGDLCLSLAAGDLTDLYSELGEEER